MCDHLANHGHEVHILCHGVDDDSRPAGAGYTKWLDGRFEVMRKPNPGRGLWIHRMPDDLTAVAYPRDDAPGAPLYRELDDDQLETYLDGHVDAACTLSNWFDLDVIHANQEVPMAAVAHRVEAKTDVPYVVAGHASTLEYVRSADHRYEALAVEGLEHASAVIALNRELEQRLVRACPQVRDRIRQIPVGVDVDTFRPRPVERGARQRIVFLGRVSLDKGVHVLLSCLPRIFTEKPDLEVVIAGAGPDQHALEKFLLLLSEGRGPDAADLLRSTAGSERAEWVGFVADRLELDPRFAHVDGAECLPSQVRFTGRIAHDELSELLPRADLLAVPSLVNEGFPLVCLEALSSGVPFVGLRQGGLAAVLDRVTQEIPAIAELMGVDPDPDHLLDDLSNHLIRILRYQSDATHRLNLRRLARNLATQRYSWRSVAESLAASYQDAIASRRLTAVPDNLPDPHLTGVSNGHRSHGLW